MSRAKRHVEWDEANLIANAEYHRLHPVTKPIDEPKTPYVYGDDGGMDTDEDERKEAPHDDSWDPSTNLFVRKLKEKIQDSTDGKPVAPISSSGRPMLLPGTATGELEKKKHEHEFKMMRRAVYADEGIKFREMLARKHDDDDED
ncbi:unnamed protein product [Phytomonas sp. EM1]|nr:unnamed protein product [Phytomonas sp. EM1]|eukprot:CCW59541.1 unnamed protein product [Phytomonas sp. isolate EM1]